MPIPKIIHYCWLSHNPVPQDYLQYVTSWKIKLPEYQFILWDTKRFDIHRTIWTKQAFESGMYACASDYIRLFAVYRYGGIYLDMDMEIIKPFDELLNEEVMIAYENHINQNIEAGCFGAVSGHEYIKGCMEYFEGRPFFEEGEREKILEMEETERHEYINPVILPEIMKDRLRHFKDRGYPIYNRDYFTAKNIVTGAIEKSEKTYTIHHFATQYHSEEWRKGREMEQRIRRIFGEGTIVSKIVQKVVMVINRMRREGIRRGVEHYYKKYIKDKGRRKKNGT